MKRIAAAATRLWGWTTKGWRVLMAQPPEVVLVVGFCVGFVLGGVL